MDISDSHEKQEVRMKTTKLIADMLTVSRILIAILLIWLGWSQGFVGWRIVAALLIYSWLSDVLDGVLARRSRLFKSTWIGDHDLYFDMLVALSLLVFMTAASTINLSISIIYILVWILVFSRFGFLSALGKLFQAPIYGWFIISTFLVDPAIGGLLVLFLILIVVVTWPRFPNDTVPSFLSGFNDNPPHQSS